MNSSNAKIRGGKILMASTIFGISGPGVLAELGLGANASGWVMNAAGFGMGVAGLLDNGFAFNKDDIATYTLILRPTSLLNNDDGLLIDRTLTVQRGEKQFIFKEKNYY